MPHVACSIWALCDGEAMSSVSNKLRLKLSVAALTFFCSVAALAIGGEEAFLAENNDAMARMMDAMTVKPTGDIDKDFVAMMVPHHQGAIDMARAVLRYGHNEQIRRLAQEIIVTQQQEIVAMRLAVGEPLPPSTAALTQPASTPPAHATHGAAPMSPSMKMK